MTNKRTWVLALLTVALMLSFATIGMAQKNKKDKGKPKPPPELDLPAVRYRINFVQGPGRIINLSDFTNSGIVVGRYWDVDDDDDERSSAFIYFPGSEQAIDLNTLVTAGIPDGAWLRSAVGINEWGVVVGSMEHDTGEFTGYAMDIWADNPVVDLLPDFGLGYSYGAQVNENGDILGIGSTLR